LTELFALQFVYTALCCIRERGRGRCIIHGSNVMFDLSLQLKITSMHLNNIFNVPQVVSETYDLIKDGRLLEAHRK